MKNRKGHWENTSVPDFSPSVQSPLSLFSHWIAIDCVLPLICKQMLSLCIVLLILASFCPSSTRLHEAEQGMKPLSCWSCLPCPHLPILLQFLRSQTRWRMSCIQNVVLLYPNCIVGQIKHTVLKKFLPLVYFFSRLFTLTVLWARDHIFLCAGCIYIVQQSPNSDWSFRLLLH